VIAHPEVYALVFAAPELSPQVVVSAVEPGLLFVAAVSVADVAEPDAFVHIIEVLPSQRFNRFYETREKTGSCCFRFQRGMFISQYFQAPIGQIFGVALVRKNLSISNATWSRQLHSPHCCK
jgi:hypothetical protein